MSYDAWFWCASIFLWALCTGVGVPPVPEEAAILYAAGVTALHPEVPWWVAWPAVSLGIISADLVLYGAGRLFGERLLSHRWMQKVLSPERRKRLEERFHRHGIKFLLLARVLPPLRTGVFVMAGSSRYPLTRFLLADVIYGVVGVGLVYFGGAALLSVIHRLGKWLLLAAAPVVLYLLVHYYRHLKKLELKAAAEVAEATEVTAEKVKEVAEVAAEKVKEAAEATAEKVKEAVKPGEPAGSAKGRE
jgi:membrane protein DedA with SNARE-associated domain